MFWTAQICSEGFGSGPTKILLGGSDAKIRPKWSGETERDPPPSISAAVRWYSSFMIRLKNSPIWTRRLKSVKIKRWSRVHTLFLNGPLLDKSWTHRINIYKIGNFCHPNLFGHIQIPLCGPKYVGHCPYVRDNVRNPQLFLELKAYSSKYGAVAPRFFLFFFGFRFAFHKILTSVRFLDQTTRKIISCENSLVPA